MQRGWVQTYIVTELRGQYQEAERKMSRKKAQNALDTRHIRYNTLDLLLLPFFEHYTVPKPTNQTDDCNESEGTVTYTVLLTSEQIKVFCTNEHQILHITVLTVPKYK